METIDIMRSTQTNMIIALSHFLFPFFKSFLFNRSCLLVLLQLLSLEPE